MRCPEVCDVNGKQVRCMTSLSGRPHFAHSWVKLLDHGGRMEIHWRTKPVNENAGQMRDGVCRTGLHRWGEARCERCGLPRAVNA